MDLDILLSNYEPAYYDSWDEWFGIALAYEGNPTTRLVNDLKDELQLNGSFNTPVRLAMESHYFDDINSEMYNFPPRVSDGMHRLAAHYSVGNKNVKVEYDYNRSTSDEKSSLTVDLLIDVQDTMYDEDALMDEIKDLLSFRYDSHTWVTNDGLSLNGKTGKAELILYLTGIKNTEISYSRLRKIIDSKLVHFPFSAVVTKIYVEDYESKDDLWL